MKRYFLIVTLLLIWAEFISAQTFLTGKVIDGETGLPVFFANISVYQGDNFIKGDVTNEEGDYRFPIDPGTYRVEASEISYQTMSYEPVTVYKDQFNIHNISFAQQGHDLPVFTVTVEQKLIKPGDTEGGIKLKGKEIENTPFRDLSGVIGSVPGISQLEEGAPIYIHGVRSSGTVYYIDDVRVSGAQSLVPLSEIEELNVITGGFSPQYGDVTGGVISITTRGMSNTWGGGLELESSQFLDAYGQQVLNAYVSGPLVKNKKGASVLGVRLGAQWNRKLDDAPSAIPIPYASETTIDRLNSNPVVLSGTTIESAAGLLTSEDIEYSKYQRGEENERLDLSGKLTARISPFIDISIGGSYAQIKDKFTPNGLNRTGTNWRLLNYKNNPTDLRNNFRGNFKFRHRLGNSWLRSEEENKEASGISFLQYNFIIGFEKLQQRLEDPRHQDRLFDYGHIGKFDFDYVPVFNPVGNRHTDYQSRFINYEVGSANPLLANYNIYANPEDYNSYSRVNGETRAGLDNIYSLHANINEVYNRYSIRNNDRFSLSTNLSFDYKPKNKPGIHAIKLGFQYEQQTNRGYQIDPRELWLTARQSANNHFGGIDTLQVIDSFMVNGFMVPIHPTEIGNTDNATFIHNIRNLTGDALDEFVNIDGIDPSLLTLGLFSAEEINDSGNRLNMNYWGYDYTGKKLKRKVTFNDFFTEKNEDGIRTLPVASAEPNYFGFYLQDKFAFKDMYFSIGLRVDRYDANAPVLKDPYSLYEIMSAADFEDRTNQSFPSNLNPESKVYTEGATSDKVIGYRDGEQWFDAEGNPVNSGAQIFGGEIVSPKFYDEHVNNIRLEGFDPNNSFEDYRPDWNILPRVSFSFPISTTAQFFAHYDILSQRPAAMGLNTSRVTALDYYNFENNQPQANANLKSQHTIEYEVGYQQAVGEKSAITLTAFYKELRNLIQQRTYLYLPSPITSYTTYSNIDFGTVKGFTFAYNTKRIGNLQANASYSLLFADGTGSNADSRRGLTSSGNIRTLYPLDYDERHQLQLGLDFRFGHGAKYNGPRIWGKKIFQNAGLNIQTTAISGRPFTSKARPTILDGNGTIGQINGVRLPWQNVIHLKVNKFIPFSKDADGFGVNLYLRVQNLLDKNNIRSVYPATGSPSDDGYLQSNEGQDGINDLANQPERQAGYINAYNWRLVNPNLFTLGRRIFMGATFKL